MNTHTHIVVRCFTIEHTDKYFGLMHHIRTVRRPALYVLSKWMRADVYCFWLHWVYLLDCVLAPVESILLNGCFVLDVI